jgi:hypothetical protein
MASEFPSAPESKRKISPILTALASLGLVLGFGSISTQIHPSRELTAAEKIQEEDFKRVALLNEMRSVIKGATKRIDSSED